MIAKKNHCVRSYRFSLQFFFEHRLPLVESAEFVDFVLVLSPYFDLLFSNGGFFVL